MTPQPRLGWGHSRCLSELLGPPPPALGRPRVPVSPAPRWLPRRTRAEAPHFFFTLSFPSTTFVLPPVLETKGSEPPGPPTPAKGSILFQVILRILGGKGARASLQPPAFRVFGGLRDTLAMCLWFRGGDRGRGRGQESRVEGGLFCGLSWLQAASALRVSPDPASVSKRRPGETSGWSRHPSAPRRSESLREPRPSWQGVGDCRSRRRTRSWPKRGCWVRGPHPERRGQRGQPSSPGLPMSGGRWFSPALPCAPLS